MHCIFACSFASLMSSLPKGEKILGSCTNNAKKLIWSILHYMRPTTTWGGAYHDLERFLALFTFFASQVAFFANSWFCDPYFARWLSFTFSLGLAIWMCLFGFAFQSLIFVHLVLSMYSSRGRLRNHVDMCHGLLYLWWVIDLSGFGVWVEMRESRDCMGLHIMVMTNRSW